MNGCVVDSDVFVDGVVVVVVVVVAVGDCVVLLLLLLLLLSSRAPGAHPPLLPSTDTIIIRFSLFFHFFSCFQYFLAQPASASYIDRRCLYHCTFFTQISPPTQNRICCTS